jgi:hypothetical protein
MLEPILDPFERPAGEPRGDAEHNDVREQSEL